MSASASSGLLVEQSCGAPLPVHPPRQPSSAKMKREEERATLARARREVSVSQRELQRCASLPGTRTSKTSSIWVNPNRVVSVEARVQHAVEEMAGSTLERDPYPAIGPPTRNDRYRATGCSYQYRRREPSREVAGQWARLSARHRTESERVGASAREHAWRDHSPARQRATMGADRLTRLASATAPMLGMSRSMSCTSLNSYDDFRRLTAGRQMYLSPFVDKPHPAVEVSLKAYTRGAPSRSIQSRGATASL